MSDHGEFNYWGWWNSRLGQWLCGALFNHNQMADWDYEWMQVFICERCMWWERQV